MLLFLCSHVWNLQPHDHVHPICGFSRTCSGCDGFIEVEFMCLSPHSYNGICDVLHLQLQHVPLWNAAKLEKNNAGDGFLRVRLATQLYILYLLKTNISPENWWLEDYSFPFEDAPISEQRGKWTSTSPPAWSSPRKLLPRASHCGKVPFLVGQGFFFF